MKDPGAKRDVDNTVMLLEALKGKVLAFRAVCFVEREQLKEALRDFQLSLQAMPGEQKDISSVTETPDIPLMLHSVSFCDKQVV